MNRIGKKWWIVIAAAVIVVVALGSFFVIKNKAQQMYLAGVEAYGNLNASAAIDHFSEVVAFPALFGSFVEDAAVKLAEVKAYEHAGTLWAEGQYAEAQDAFTAFSTAYPASEFYEQSQNALMDIPFEWAEEQLSAGDYEGAIQIYDQVIQDGNLPDADLEDAKGLYFDTYTTWVMAEYQDGDYERTEARLLDLVSWTETNDTSKTKDVKAILTETYLDWGDLLYGEQDYESALAKYGLSLEQDISRYAHRAEENIASVYLDWADELVRGGNLSTAGEKYGALILNYAGSDASQQLTHQACEPLILYGETLLKDGEFIDAGVVFSIAYALFEDGQDELKAAAVYGVGRAFHGGKSYLKAITLFDKALALTQDVTLQESISQSRQASIEGMGQLDNYLGKTIIFSISNDILEYKKHDTTCYTADGTKTCLNEAEMEIAYQVVGQDEEEKRHLLFIEGAGSNNYQLPDNIQATRPGHFWYVSILKESQRQVESCKYGKTGISAVSHHLVRMQKIFKVYMYDTRTGLLVQVGTFYGSDPMTCPRTYTFHGTTEYVTGGEPDMDEVIVWLRSYAK